MKDKSYYKKNPKLKERISAGGVIIRKNNSELLIGLIRDSNYNDYLLPKGGVEEGEDLVDTAKREIMEEAGLNNLFLVDYLGKSEHLAYNKNFWSVSHYYLFLTEQKSGRSTDKEVEFILEWFPIDELPEMFWQDQLEFLINNKEKIIKLINNTDK